MRPLLGGRPFSICTLLALTISRSAGFNPFWGKAGAYCCSRTIAPPCPTCFLANAALPVVAAGVKCFGSLGIPASKLVLAFPWYGYDYTFGSACVAGHHGTSHLYSLIGLALLDKMHTDAVVSLVFGRGEGLMPFSAPTSRGRRPKTPRLAVGMVAHPQLRSGRLPPPRPLVSQRPYNSTDHAPFLHVLLLMHPFSYRPRSVQHRR